MDKDTELNIACALLVCAIHKRTTRPDYSDAWRKMSQTSAIKRRLANEGKLLVK